MPHSMMLHALSLHDRMLEPNQLPVDGRVWAYAKAHNSKEGFVGHCICMLSLMGIHDASIHWSEDIMACDVTCHGRKATLIISLQDDSLASNYFFFMGLWFHQRVMKKTPLDAFLKTDTWEKEDLLEPAFSYAVRVSDRPLTLVECQKRLGSDLFSQHIYDQTWLLCGKTEIQGAPCGNFIIYPLQSNESTTSGNDVQHALYSLRNVMALMTQSILIHSQVQSPDTPDDLGNILDQLIRDIGQPHVEHDVWDTMIRACGSFALNVIHHMDKNHSLRIELHNIQRLFHTIFNELSATDIEHSASLKSRMLISFEHANDLLQQQSEALQSYEKQAAILQQQLHNRLLLVR